jgi:hypothetical protein
MKTVAIRLLNTGVAVGLQQHSCSGRSLAATG